MPEKIDIPVTGMTCAACASAIERALKKLDGLEGAVVNLSAEKVTVQFREGTQHPPVNEIIDTIRDEGYGVRTERMDFSVRGMTCAACVSAVERSVKERDGVVDVNVNLATQKATVEFVPTLVGFGDFRKAVEEAGYTAEQATEAGQADREKETTKPAKCSGRARTHKREWVRRR